MKKIICVSLLISAILCISACNNKDIQEAVANENIVQPDFVKEELDEKFGTDEVYIVKTIMKSSDADAEGLVGNGLYIMKTHYQLSDGTWKTDEHSYKYKLIITGRMNNAAKDSTYHILSNRSDITFDMAWKAFGYSSNMDDYFKPEEAVFVAVE